MNAMNEIAEARAAALVLRATGRAVRGEQDSLRLQLIRAAESLDAIVLLAIRGIERIEQLEQELRQFKAGGQGGGQ